MQKVPFELTYKVTVDENGVFDGRDIAEGLIRDAYKFLVPYAEGCPGCSDSLFTVIANNVISELRAGKELPGTMMAASEEDSAELHRAHREATRERTARLLEIAGREDCHWEEAADFEIPF